MTRPLAITSLLLAAAFAGSAFAESPVQGSDAFSGSRTRAEVQAELAQFNKGPNPWSTSYNPVRHFESSTSRAAVTADYIASREQVSALNGEDSGSSWLTAGRSTRSVETLAGQPHNAR